MKEPPLNIHALVIGGTGMLRGVVVALARRGAHVTVIARRPNLDERKAAYPGRVVGVAADYRLTDSLTSAIHAACAARGPLALAVAWIQDDAPDAIHAVAAQMARSLRPCRLLHVLSSAHADPGRSAEPAVVPALGGVLTYQEVILGFRRDGPRSRWLRHDEIVDGVLDALRAGRPRSVVGTVTPWSARP